MSTEHEQDLPFSVFMNPGVFCKVFSLSEGFVASFTNERFVDNAHAGGALDRGRDLVLDDGRGLTQGVPLGLRLDGPGPASGHVDALDGDPVPLGVPLPHGVGVVDEQVAVREGGPGHTHQLEGVGRDLKARGAAGRDGRHRDNRLRGGHGAARPRGRGLLGDGDCLPLAGGVVLDSRYWDRHVDRVWDLS